jgi:hypothetical protein
LSEEQAGLETRADQIADALVVQADEIAAAPQDAGPDAGEGAERIQKAAEYVASAGLAMRDAGELLEAERLPLDGALAGQDLAIEDLKQALALLSPPPQESPQEESEESDESEQGDDGDKSDSESPEESDSGQGGQDSESPDEEGMDDPSQLLQGVRDREAERRRDLDRRNQSRRAEPVDKDW